MPTNEEILKELEKLRAEGIDVEPFLNKWGHLLNNLVWHYLAPEYVSELLDRVEQDRCWIDHEIIASVSVTELINNGCVTGSLSRNGQNLVIVDPVALLVCKEFKLLKRWLSIRENTYDSLFNSQYDNLLNSQYEYYVNGNKDMARRKLDAILKQNDCAEAIVLLIIAYGETESANHYLGKLKKEASSLIVNAKIWSILFHNTDLSLECIKKARQLVNDSRGWIELAECVKILINDDFEVRDCLKKAELLSDCGSEWAECAEAWKILCNDNSNARRCIENCSGIPAAGAWKSIFNDNQKAHQALKAEEQLVDDPITWQCLAIEWKTVLNNDSEARRCMYEAEKNSKDSWDWNDSAKIWRKIFNDDVEANRCERIAASLKENSDLF